MPSDQDILFEKILELALKDKLVLWAGAGLSREAGYPTGGELAEKLYERLTEEEQEFVPRDLLKVSDYLVNRGGKNGRDDMISILKEIFNIEHKHSESHEMIKKMAFFRTIITTNYDELFETSIPEIQIIKTTKDLARAKSNLRKLIKIHGDLKSPKQLILTQNDYSALYERDYKDPFWNLIRVELTQKGVLFIGYGFNDPNVEGLFTYLSKKLKRYDHPKYLVAPSLTLDQQVRLKSFKIQYVNQTGKEFLQKLYNEAWKTKGYKYFGLPEVSTDALFNSLNEEGLPFNISQKAEGGRLIQFNPETGKVWDLTFTSSDKEVKSRITDWQKGLGSDDLLLPKELISDAYLKIGDFVVGDKDTIPEFQFQRIGHIEKDVRIIFENSGVEIFLQKVRSHRYSDNGLKIITENDHGKFEIIIPEILSNGYSFTSTFTPKDPCKSISGILNWHEAIYSLGMGEAFKIYSSKFPKGFSHPNGAQSRNLEVLKRNRLIFKTIRKIEEKFKIGFIEVSEVEIFNNEFLNVLQGILDLFKTNKLKRDLSQGIPIRSLSSKPEEDVIPFINQVHDNGYLVLNNMESSVKILNQEVDLGKSQVFVGNPYLEESKKEQGVFLLKSKNDECFVMYEAFGLPKLKDGVVPN